MLDAHDHGVYFNSHYPFYQQQCKELDIPENHFAIPRVIWKEMEEKRLKGKKQEKLDKMLEIEKKPWEFTCEGVLHAVAQLVACDDQVWCERSS
jgi:hypothetical protein